MAALVEFPIMATSLGTIPNRCLSVTKRQPPGHEASKASGRDAPHSRHGFPDLEPPVDRNLYIDGDTGKPTTAKHQAVLTDRLTAAGIKLAPSIEDKIRESQRNSN